MITNKWKSIVEYVDLAFQPIVDIKTGEIVAYESLLRDYQSVGFYSIDEFFNTAHEEQVLYGVDLLLREKALKKLKPLFNKNDKFGLFYNIDNRILDMKDYENGHTKDLLNKYGYSKKFITFEISEKHQFSSFIDAQTIFNIYSEQGFSIALDDFGTGFSGLKMLYYLNPQYIKIDRFFITDILKDKKKKMFVSNIVNIARQSNIIVLAEGVETLDELMVCKEIGCDLVQGYFVQRPTQNIDELKFLYENILIPESFEKKYCIDVCKDEFNLDNVYRFSNVYNNLIDRYIISSSTNTKGIITSVSDAFCKISGYSRAELIGKNHNIVRNRKNKKSLFKDIWKALKNGEVWSGEISNERKDGSIYWVEAVISPNYDEDGILQGYTSLRVDITYDKLKGKK